MGVTDGCENPTCEIHGNGGLQPTMDDVDAMDRTAKERLEALPDVSGTISGYFHSPTRQIRPNWSDSSRRSTSTTTSRTSGMRVTPE